MVAKLYDAAFSVPFRLHLHLLLLLLTCTYTAALASFDPVLRLGLLRHTHDLPHSHPDAIHDAVQRSTLRAIDFAAAAAAVNLPISSAITRPYADFITTLAVGTPPMPFTAVVDTGSSMVWQQCKPCFSCYTQNNPIFDPSLSSSYKKALCSDPLCLSLPTLFDCDPTVVPPITCIYNNTYSLGSGSGGEFSYDTLTLHDAAGEKTVAFPHFGFGCGLVNSNPFNFTGAAGVVGLGRGFTSLISQLNINEFSYCLQTFSAPSNATSPLFLGPIQAGQPVADRVIHSRTKETTITTPIVSNMKNPSPYYINMKGISVGGKNLQLPRSVFELRTDGTGGMIVDSGSLSTLLPEIAYAAVLRTLQENIHAAPMAVAPKATGGLDLCYARKMEVPKVTLHLDGGDLSVPAERLFVEMKGVGYCLVMGASRGGSPGILGNYLQQNLHVVYDLKSKMLSFTPTHCHTL